MIINLLKKVYGIFYFLVYGGDRYARKLGVKVGKGCRIYITQWGSEPFLVSIGDKVTITSGVKILTHDGSTWLFEDDRGQRYQKYGPVKIGSHVFIGVNSIIMPGVTVGDRVVIGAGSIVTKDIKSGSVVVGNPARVVSSYDQLAEKIKETCISNSDIDGVEDYKKKVLKSIELQKRKGARRDA